MDSSRGDRFRLSNQAWRAKLVAAQRPSLFDRGQLYVPWEDVRRITDPDNVTKEALELLGVNKGEYAKLVRGRERILCTLIYSYLTHMFLPICRKQIELRYGFLKAELLPVDYSIENGVITVGNYWERLKMFSGCEESEIYDFCDSQWRFAVPVLNWDILKEHRLFDQVYHPRAVFPFDSEILPITTPFSRVWKVKIHTSHVRNSSLLKNKNEYPRPEFVALKESVINADLRVDAEVQEALNERRIHGKLSRSGISNPWRFKLHLTELYWAFRRQNTHYMIFPWAEGGSLGDIWQKDPERFTATNLRQWMEKNIIGLLGAVDLLHKLNCSHGDLKPGNILVFSEQKNPDNPEQRDYSYKFRWAKNDATSTVSLPRDLGTLKITDFGTVRANSDATIDRTRDANALTGAQRYAPPEFDRNELAHNSPRSRLYDVWSMGCILLEFITWVCYGRGGVQRLSSRLEEPYPGRFWTSGENKQKTLHPYVRHQFRKLKRRLEDTGTDKEWLEWLNKELKEYLLQLLEVVRTQMLVVNLDKEIHAARKEPEDSCTDEEGNSSEGTGTIHRVTAEPLHAQLYESIKSSNMESVEEEDPSPSPTLSTEELQAVPSTALKYTDE